MPPAAWRPQVYRDADGQEHTGSTAYRRYKGSSGAGGGTRRKGKSKSKGKGKRSKGGAVKAAKPGKR